MLPDESQPLSHDSLGTKNGQLNGQLKRSPSMLQQGVGKCGPPHQGAWEGGQRHLGSGECTGPESFPVNATGVQCHDLKRSKIADSPAGCAAACCAEATCDTWQWELHGPGPAPGPAPPAPVTWKNATLIAKSGEHVLATHSVYAPSTDASGYKLQLTLDVPSATTGTGSALVMDGRDTALVRCAIVDSNANDALVASATDLITWRVTSGAGRLVGQSNGNRSSHTWMKSHSVNAFLGLARGLFAVTEDCTSDARAECATIDVDAGKGPTKVKAACDTSPIVIEATVRHTRTHTRVRARVYTVPWLDLSTNASLVSNGKVIETNLQCNVM
jgi:hypothetical protein